MPSVVNLPSSVKRMSATNCVWKIHHHFGDELISGHTMDDRELLIILLSNLLSNPVENTPYKLR
jgi:hypothetical protein